MKNAYLDKLIARAEIDAQRGCTKSMCILHLLDLKRAGHSPKTTELTILEGHTPQRIDTPYQHGSSSVAGWLVA